MKFRLVIILLMTLCLGFNVHAQSDSFEPVLTGGVYRSTSQGKLVDKKPNSYESVNFFIIDNTPVLMLEYGETNDRGFVNEESIDRVYFTLKQLKFEFDGNSATWSGYAVNKATNKSNDIRMTLNGDGTMTLSVNTAIFYCNNIRNYNIDLLNQHSQVVEPRSSNNDAQHATPKRQSKPHQSSKPPLKK